MNTAGNPVRQQVILLALFLLEAVFTGLLLSRRVRLHHTVKKQLASAVFVAASLTCAIYTGFNSYAVLLLVGAVCGWVGDLVIDFDGTLPFLGGMAAFFAGHVFYTAAFAAGGKVFLNAPLFRGTEWAFTAAVLAVFVLLAVVLKMRFKGLAIPVLLYAVVISLMTVKACTLGIGLLAVNPGAVVLILGAALFVFSDAVLALERFHDKASSDMSKLNLITYYSGQMLLAITPVVIYAGAKG